MRNLFEKMFHGTQLYYLVMDWRARRRGRKEVAQWRRLGCPLPPPHVVKQQTLKDYARQFSLNILVETGTFMGDMVAAMKPYVKHIYSIELDPLLFNKAKARFRYSRNVHLIQGDSAHQLIPLVGNIKQPALFWLDGHYSAGFTAKGEKLTPIIEELRTVLESKISEHVIVIDDARCFNGTAGYPTFYSITSLVQSLRPEAHIEKKDDMIRITPCFTTLNAKNNSLARGF